MHTNCYDALSGCYVIMQEEWTRENLYFQQLEQKEAMEDKMKRIEKLSVKVVTCKEVCLCYTVMRCTACHCHPLSVAIRQNMPVSGAKRVDTISRTRELKRDFLHVCHAIHIPYHMTDILQNLASKVTTTIST